MRNSKEFFRTKFLRISSEFLEKTVIPQKSLILGINSGEFLENFQGISYMKWFSRNSSEILQRKSPRLENLGKYIPHFCYLGRLGGKVYGRGKGKGKGGTIGGIGFQDILFYWCLIANSLADDYISSTIYIFF